MIVKTINIQVISVYESIMLCVILFILRFIKKKSPKISKEEVIHNMIQKQQLTIPKSVSNRSIGYVLFRKYTMYN